MFNKLSYFVDSWNQPDNVLKNCIKSVKILKNSSVVFQQ